MKPVSLKNRYDTFCLEAEGLLERAGFAREGQTPQITGKAFYEACVALATIHFPDDTEVSGKGPRDLLWGMYGAVQPSHVGGKDPDPVSGARSIAAVLQQIIKHRPGLEIDRRLAPQGGSPATSPPRDVPKPKTGRVFVVHGHHTASKESVARFLEQLGISAVILHEEANEGRTVIEKFESHSSVDFAVVLLTPDDVGHAMGKPEQARPRARQNVLFEWGYFVGRIGRTRVCALYDGDVEIPSDYSGVLYLPMDSAGSWKLLLAKELKQAGVDFDADNILGR